LQFVLNDYEEEQLQALNHADDDPKSGVIFASNDEQ
jgi:hypothetical protein